MSDFFQTGGDEIDFDRAASAFPDISLDGEGDIPIPTQPPVRQASSGFSFDSFATPPIPQDSAVKVTGDDELEKFASEFPDIDVPQPEPPLAQPSFSGATYAPRPQPSAYTSTPILNQPLEEDEPQVIKDWRAKQQAEIEARDEASKARRQETISKAERAIDEFYENYAEKKEKNIRENKDQEAEYLASVSESLSKGTTWERISDLIELQNSQSKTIARTGAGTTDLTRFKEVLLRLKREGDAAPGAAGY
ncbi:putative clathrin is the major protein of the polyhedral coat of coated pits and vesicles [Lyophyllum shimeji]|uniref:Clathrin light chain n=1 Tax=Lyophyllum shimeji TaxID=47721 RepID=A0A9P3PKZ3_LYOSH|nr:putative clathrin is the major protein of the polyhedral coat of coated pits and vesicles [Lyophyllum shimeji]